MKATRDQMKAEAVRRMKRMGYYEPSIELFRKENAVMLNEPPMSAHYIIDADNCPETYPVLAPIIERLEHDGSCLVYAVIMSLSNVGTTFEFLYVESSKEEWGTFDRDIADGITFCYCYNKDDPQGSDFGNIEIKRTIAGGIRRVG